MLARNVEYIDASIFGWIPSKFIVVPLLLMHALIFFFTLGFYLIFMVLINSLCDLTCLSQTFVVIIWFFSSFKANKKKPTIIIFCFQYKKLIIPHQVIVLIEDPNKQLIFHYYVWRDELVYYRHVLELILHINVLHRD